MATKEAPKSPREGPKSPREGPKSPKVDTSGPCAPLFQGYLSKKGGSKGGRRNWKKRYFVLTGDDLRYYENYQAFISKPTQPKGAVALRYYDKIVDSTETSNEQHPFCFLLEAGERKLFMSSAARMTKGEWIDAIASIGEMHKFMVAKTERSSVMLGTVENGLIEISFKLLEKVSTVVTNVYSFIDEVNSKDPNVSNILTVVKDLGLSTCLSMRAFLRAIKFVGEYNLQACLLNADKIIGILRKLEEVTRTAVEKAAQTQKVSLITNMLGVKTLLAEDLKRTTNLAPRNRAQSTERPLPKKGKEKDPNVNGALDALSEMAFENTLQGGQNNPLYGHDSATNSPMATRKKTLSDVINLAGAHVDVANDTIESMENTLNLNMSRQLTNTPRSPGPSPMVSPRPNGVIADEETGNNTNVLQPAAENGEVKHVDVDGVPEPVFTHSNAAYSTQMDGTLGPDNGSAKTTAEPVQATTPRTPRAPESDIKAADIEMLKADIGLLSQFLTIGSPFEPNDDDPIEMIEENVKRISINDDILTEVDYDLTKPKETTPEPSVPKPVEEPVTNGSVDTAAESKPDDDEVGDSSSSSEELIEEESDDDAVISVIVPKTPRDIVLPVFASKEPTPVTPVTPVQPTPEEPVQQPQEQPFRSGDLVRGDSNEVSSTAVVTTQPSQAESPVVESPPRSTPVEQGPLSSTSQSSQSSEPSSTSAPRSSEVAAPKPIVEYKGNNSSPSTPRGLAQIEIPKVRTSSLRSKGDRMPEITFTSPSKTSVGDEGPLSSTYSPPSVKVSITGANDKRTSSAEEETDNFRLSMTYAPGQNQLGSKKAEAKSWRRSTRFSSRISDLSNRQPEASTNPSALPDSAAVESNTNAQNNTNNNNADQPLRQPALSDVSNRAMSKSSGYFISVVYINGLHRLNVETHPMSPYLDILDEGRTDVFISLQRGIYAAWNRRKAADNQEPLVKENNTNSNNNEDEASSSSDESQSSEPKDPLPEEKTAE